MRATLVVFLASLVTATAGWADDWVAILRFPVGQAELTAAHRTTLDSLRSVYPPATHAYRFEGDHDATRFRGLSPSASQRLNEQLAETRWQNVAQYLGAPSLGAVRSTGRTEVRIAVERPSEAARIAALEDSIAGLRSELGGAQGMIQAMSTAMVQEGERSQAMAAALAAATAEPAREPTIARLEEIHLRVDKWLEERWWEGGSGIEVGLFRGPDRALAPGDALDRLQPWDTGLTLGFADGTFAYHALEIHLRLDTWRLGTRRFGLTPALRLDDWSLRVHFGDDKEAGTSLASDADPVALLGLGLDAKPWRGAFLHVDWAGLGTRVHANHRVVESYDHFDLQFEQRLARAWWFALQGVYDERFEKPVAYAGGWLGYGWGVGPGEGTVQLGYVHQLDALAATTGARREIGVHTASLEVGWRRGWGPGR